MIIDTFSGEKHIMEWIVAGVFFAIGALIAGLLVLGRSQGVEPMSGNKINGSGFGSF